MKPEFNYELIPYGFAHCLNKQCKRVDECLRYQAMLHIPSGREYFTIVNPSLIQPTGENCPYFKADKLQPFARGIKHLLDPLPHSDAEIIKHQMLKHFGKTLYYRFWRGERFISPDQQKYIQQLFLKKGITTTPLYEEYVEQYEW